MAVIGGIGPNGGQPNGGVEPNGPTGEPRSGLYPGIVNWTVDAPVEVLPELPPLPADLRARLDEALVPPRRAAARLARRRSTSRTSAPCWRASRRSRCRRRSTGCTTRLADVAEGRAFLLQGGDCAETFVDNTEPHIRATIRTLLQMAVVLTYGASLPVVKVGRIAGQYAKPRSAPDRRAGPALLPRRHRQLARRRSRRADPRPVADGPRLRQRGRGDEPGAGADRHRHGRPHAWCTTGTRTSCRTSPAGARFEAIAAEIERALRFMDACGVRRPQPAQRRVLRLATRRC